MCKRAMLRALPGPGLPLLLALLLSSCGAGATGQLAGAAQPGASQAGSGVTAGSGGMLAGGFEVLRYSASGHADPALNGTLSLRLEQRDGRTALKIDVADAAYTTVALEVRYDAERVHPLEVEYAGLLGSDKQVLSAAFLDTPGQSSLGQTAIGDYRPPALHGRFATLYFADGPAPRTASSIGEVHQNPYGVDGTIEGIPNFDMQADLIGQSVQLTWYGAWHIGDGDQNGEVNIADISPIGLYFAQITASNWAAVRADYDHNTEVNLSDLTPVGQYFGESTTSYTIEASDNVDGAARTFIASVDWDAGEPFDSASAAAGQLYPAFNRWNYTITATSAFNYEALYSLDANSDVCVNLYVTPQLDNGALSEGASATKELVFAYSDGPDALTIDAFNVKAAGAVGGAGENVDLFGSAATQMSVLANQQLTLSLDSFSGTYSTAWESFDFDSADPSSIPLSAYELDNLVIASREAILGRLTWDAQQAGAAGFRWTGPWLTDSGGASSGIGDPGLCTVFPDDDPQSDSSSPEGLLVLSLPAGEESLPATGSGFGVNMFVGAEIRYTITADVTADPAVPVLLAYYDETLGPLSELYLYTDTPVKVAVGLSGLAPPLSAYSSYVLELRSVDGGDATAAPITFTYSDVFPLAPGQFGISDPPAPGEPLGSTGLLLDCKVQGPQLVPGWRYAFRLDAGDGFSSINKPEALLDVVAPAG